MNNHRRPAHGGGITARRALKYPRYRPVFPVGNRTPGQVQARNKRSNNGVGHGSTKDYRFGIEQVLNHADGPGKMLRRTVKPAQKHWRVLRQQRAQIIPVRRRNTIVTHKT